MQHIPAGCSKTVAILGGAYAGARAAQVLAQDLPDGWRIVLVDRNSHVNHVYVLPRLAVLSGHEHKAFVPYDNIFLHNNPTSPSTVFIQACVTAFHCNSVTLSHSFPEHGIPDNTLNFDYVIYALGSHLPTPVNLWSNEVHRSCKLSDDSEYRGMKTQGIEWLKRNQTVIEKAASILVVGGGALGIQFVSDIAEVHPGKRITLLHSRHRLLPRFDPAMHTEILQSLESLNVEVILGERLDLQSTRAEKLNERDQRVVNTMSGRAIAADLLLLCTGQTPNTAFLADMDRTTVDPETGLAHVLRTMQLGVLPQPSPPPPPSVDESPTPLPEPAHFRVGDAGVDVETLDAALDVLSLEDADSTTLEHASLDPLSTSLLLDDDEDATEDNGEFEETTPYPHVFVVGDAADAFGAIKAGHNAYYQAEVAARNVLRLIRKAERRVPAEGRASASSGEAGEYESEEDEDQLETYTANAPAIKVSLGLTRCVYQINGVVGVRSDEAPDLNAAGVWSFFGARVERDEDMYA